MGQRRTILHLDMDAFFAAVELRRHPELSGQPVIVGGEGDPRQRGVVAAASYEARRYGIHAGMALRRALHNCPGAVFLSLDLPSYRRVSKAFKAILRGFSPVMEDLGIDEACIDISGMKDPLEIGRRLKEEIRAASGLSCSVGIAANKLLAKMACELGKPEGLTLLVEDEVEGRIWPLPVRRLPQVGPKSEEVLRAVGVATIGDLKGLSKEKLTALFGPARAAWFYSASRGIDERPLVTVRQPQSFGRERTFQHDVADRRTIEAALEELERQVAERLHRRGYRGRTVTVKLRYEDFETRSRCHRLRQRSDDPDELVRIARRCLENLAGGKKVRTVGVRVSDLKRRA